MKITINTPCHENWDGMTPNAKGAFCLSCQKNVVDFSKKTIEEIREFFTELPETGSVCGRFEEEQLNEMSFDHFFHHFRSWKYFQKAAVIAFFVFGFSLFGCAQNNNHNHHVKMGMVAYVPTDTTKINCRKDTTRHKQPIKGKVKVTPDRPKKPKQPPPPIMGDVMIEDNRR